MPFCRKCGNRIEDADLFCSKCGTSVEQPTVAIEQFQQKHADTQANKKNTGLIIAVVALCAFLLLAKFGRGAYCY